MREIVPGIHTWSTYSDERGMTFNGYAIATPGGTVLVDPVDPGAEGWAGLDALAPFDGVHVTNRSHVRAAGDFRARYGVPVRIGAADAARAGIDADATLRGGETLGGAVRVVAAPGKSPGELAFLVPLRRALVVGDVVIGVPGGELSTYPGEKIDDHAELLRSAARLAALDFDALLLCDGAPLPVGGRAALRRFVAAQSAGASA